MGALRNVRVTHWGGVRQCAGTMGSVNEQDQIQRFAPPLKVLVNNHWPEYVCGVMLSSRGIEPHLG